jgi:Protein of unknown function (DUF3431)
VCWPVNLLLFLFSNAGDERHWPNDCPSHAAFSYAREADAYLRFIIEHWDCLPDATVFLHGHQ